MGERVSGRLTPFLAIASLLAVAGFSSSRAVNGQASAPVGSELVGCFKDTADFDLDGFLERSAANTPQRCVTRCRSLGYRFAGVQYSESCLCGNSYGRYGPADNCTMACTGDPGQTCGGYSSNLVYRVDLPEPSLSGSGSVTGSPGPLRSATALAYRGIVPGASSRAEAERALGPPLRSLGALSQHRLEDGTRIYLHVGAGNVVERLNVAPPEPVDPGRTRTELGVGTADFARVNAERQLEEGFRAAQIVLTHAGADAASAVEQIGYLDDAAFQAMDPGGATAVPTTTRTAVAGVAPPPPPPPPSVAPPVRPPPSPPAARAPEVGGWTLSDLRVDAPDDEDIELSFAYREAPLRLSDPEDDLTVALTINCPGEAVVRRSYEPDDVDSSGARAGRVTVVLEDELLPSGSARDDCQLELHLEEPGGGRSSEIATSIRNANSARENGR